MNRALACFWFSVLLYAIVIGAMLTLCLDPPKEASRFTASVEESDPFTPLTDEELARLRGDASDSQFVVALDTEAAAIAVELTDFSEETLPKNDLMATIGAFTGCGLVGRGEPPPRYAWFWGR